MDTISEEHRSWNMSRIRSENTSPEKLVRSLLHGMGYRFRLHRKDLPGKPDIVLPKYKTIIEVRGCFWHRHQGCKQASTPKSNQAFWQEKFARNVERDRRNMRSLKKLGWKVIIIWECETRNESKLAKKLRIENRKPFFTTEGTEDTEGKQEIIFYHEKHEKHPAVAGLTRELARHEKNKNLGQ